MKQTPDEKKEPHKKKTPSKKKAEIGAWPCKIDGCNKIFAREADLKRHQRTTKLHSLPGFACPQCEATFTRTDALRRHQKSRHNGVIIEPADQDKLKLPTGSEGEGVNDGSNPSHPSGIPHPMPLPGPSHYYRQHTMPPGYPPPPGVMMDPHYQAHNIIGLPTSATRGSWQPAPPPWGDGQIYHVPPGYYQSPYYRPLPGMMPHPHQPMPHPQMKHEFIIQGPPQMHNGSTSAPTHPESTQANSELASQEGQKSSSTPAPVIDPSLDGKSDSSAVKDAPQHRDDHLQPETVSMEMAEAAVHAVIESAKRREKEEEASAARNNHINGAIERDGMGDHGHAVETENAQEDDSSQENSEAAHQMILAELLTQESLASPPPS